MVEDENKKLHRNPQTLKDEYDKINDSIDKSQLEEGSKDVSSHGSDIDDSSQDLEPSEFTEESEGSIAPLEKAGSSEIEHSEDMRKRFAKKLDIDEESLRDNAPETDTTPSGGGCK